MTEKQDTEAKNCVYLSVYAHTNLQFLHWQKNKIYSFLPKLAAWECAEIRNQMNAQELPDLCILPCSLFNLAAFTQNNYHPVNHSWFILYTSLLAT